MDRLNISNHHDFSIHNLPLGIFSQTDGQKKVGMALGDGLIDLHFLARKIDFGISPECFISAYLNPILSEGRTCVEHIRNQIKALYQLGDSLLSQAWLPIEKVQLFMPIEVRNYTDFYASEQHAFNVGAMFRNPEQALMPNWKHMPIAYHGRASSVVLSGTNFYRPNGQLFHGDKPAFGATKRLDFEAEMAVVIGKANDMGQPISVESAKDYVAGFVLFNDWSARDIQKWEYQPLGPFLGKNFISSISPWLVDISVLKDFELDTEMQSPEVLPYLQEEHRKVFDISIEIYLETESGVKTLLSCTNTKYSYWTIYQMITHHTINGCNLCVGDLLASGTLSGKEKNTWGSLLELSWGGKEAITLADGSTRTFLEDGDTIVMKAYAENEHKRIGFGEVRGKVLPAHTL